MTTAAKESCLALLTRMHAFIAAGEGGSEQADALRDEMDPLWWSMTAAEQGEMRQHSARLYREAEARRTP